MLEPEVCSIVEQLVVLQVGLLDGVSHVDTVLTWVI